MPSCIQIAPMLSFTRHAVKLIFGPDVVRAKEEAIINNYIGTSFSTFDSTLSSQDVKVDIIKGSGKGKNRSCTSPNHSVERSNYNSQSKAILF